VRLHETTPPPPLRRQPLAWFPRPTPDVRCCVRTIILFSSVCTACVHMCGERAFHQFEGFFSACVQRACMRVQRAYEHRWYSPVFSACRQNDDDIDCVAARSSIHTDQWRATPHVWSHRCSGRSTGRNLKHLPHTRACARVLETCHYGVGSDARSVMCVSTQTHTHTRAHTRTAQVLEE
jgi:hypothetical protein